jgi:hypothetical protein
MRRIKQAKPSAALVVAVVALVVALGGGAVAGVAVTSLNKKDKKQVTKIAKKEAKTQGKKSNQKAKAAQASADAAQISADTAQSSANQALSQQETFSYAADATAATTTLFEGGGLRIEGRCPGADVEVDARSLADNSIIHLATNVDVPDAYYDEDDDFDTDDIEPLDVFDYADGVQGTFTFRNGQDGTIVTATYLLEEGAGADCVAYGNLEIMVAP